MGGMREATLQKTIAYILAHPDASKSEVVFGAKVSDNTVARARRILIEKGLIPESRKKDPVLPTVEMFPDDMKGSDAPVTQPDQDPAPADPGMLDHAAMIAMASMVAQAEELSDEEVQRRLMRQAQLFAFTPTLHPDTRMSASTLWAKLRDMKKDEAIGPGKPMTLLEAVCRTKDVLLAVGQVVSALAVKEAFYAEQAPDVQAPSPLGAEEAPGASRHDGDPPAPEDLRPVNVGLRIDGQDGRVPDPDLPRPEA